MKTTATSDTSISAHILPSNSRSTWTRLSDDQLLAQCEVDTYRASGPGGQKRNKTSSAVRLRHKPSGLIVIAEESRSQHANKAKVLGRMPKAIYLELREPVDLTNIGSHPDFKAARNEAGRLDLRLKDPRFWPVAGVVLDVLEATAARVSETANLLGIPTANLISFLQTDPKVWQRANALRAASGQKPLHMSS